MVVSETWLEEKERMKTKRKLLKGYIWDAQWAAEKAKKKELLLPSPTGGIIMEIKKKIVDKGTGIETDRLYGRKSIKGRRDMEDSGSIYKSIRERGNGESDKRNETVDGGKRGRSVHNNRRKL